MDVGEVVAEDVDARDLHGCGGYGVPGTVAPRAPAGNVRRPWRISSSARCCATPAAPRRPSGSRPTRPARSPCSTRAQRTFCVEGHHYALVVLSDLDAGRCGRTRCTSTASASWPPDDGRPPSTIHTREHERRARLVFGSCRVGDPEREPYTLPPAEHPLGFGIDALWALSRRLQSGSEEWPDCLLLLGDQVYADETSRGDARLHPRAPRHEPAARRAGRRLRGVRAALPRGLERSRHPLAARDRAEHDDLRRPRRARRLEHLRGVGARHARDGRGGRSASPAPSCRTGSTSTSATWLRPSWPRSRCSRSSPATTTAARACASSRARVDREPASSRFAFHRDFGRSRLVVIDSRAARVLAEGRRDMVDDEEWQWIAEHARGAYDHLIIASTLPVFMTPGVDGLEAWNEAVCSGAWGRLAARVGEKLRRALDLEHWPAFQRSFRTMVELLHELAEGAGRTRARSRSSAATCTRPTSRRSSSGERQRAASSRSSARRSATRSQPRERRVDQALQHARRGRRLPRAGAQPPASRAPT